MAELMGVSHLLGLEHLAPAPHSIDDLVDRLLLHVQLLALGDDVIPILEDLVVGAEPQYLVEGLGDVVLEGLVGDTLALVVTVAVLDVMDGLRGVDLGDGLVGHEVAEVDEDADIDILSGKRSERVRV